MTAVAQAIRSDQRHSKARPCPICGGADRDQRGKGRRCHGFTSDDYAHCTREEHAGGLQPAEKSGTYGHRLNGPCACGTTHGTDENAWRDVEAAYDYRDERGVLQYQVVRLTGKNFRQRKPDGAGGWDWKTAGMRRVLYRLPELLAARKDETIYVVEGEKDVDNLRKLGALATCNPMGAGKWSGVTDCARSVLAGRHVVVIPDGDDVGRKHAADVLSSLDGISGSVQVVALAKKDASDWIEAGGTLADLQSLHKGAIGEPTIKPGTFEHELENALSDVRNALTSTKTSAREPLFSDAASLLTAEFPLATWAIVGLLTRMGVGIIGGEPKTAKTWTAVIMALAVATGSKAFGEFFAEAGRVAYFFAEDLDKQVRNKLRALLDGAGLTLAHGRLHVCPRGKFLDITRDEDLAWIVASVRKLGGKIDLLVLDPLRDIHSADEDKSGPMSDVMRRLRLLGRLLGCTVLVVHHAAKASESTSGRRSGQKMRGSGAIHGSIDSGLYMTAMASPTPGNLRASIDTEVKGARSAGRFVLDVAIEDDGDGEAIRAVATVSRPVGKSEKPTEHSADDDKVFAFVRDLAVRGERQARTKLREHDDRPIGEARTEKALDRMIESGRLVIINSKVCIPEPAPERSGS